MRIYMGQMKGFEELSLHEAHMTKGILMIDILQNDVNVMQV